MFDDTPRLWKILDELSQLINVALLPHHKETSSNESMSARAYRLNWKTRKVIDQLLGAGHCREAYENELKRAKLYLEQKVKT